MNAKPRIAVLGGGFGGLESLFYLKYKLGDRADLTLTKCWPTERCESAPAGPKQ